MRTDQPANTAVEYQYRDAGNHKVSTRVVLAGTLTLGQVAQVRRAQHEGEWFIPGQVGLASLVPAWDPTLDHPLHELLTIEDTDEPAGTVEDYPDTAAALPTAAAFFTAFTTATWDSVAAERSLTGHP